MFLTVWKVNKRKDREPENPVKPDILKKTVADQKQQSLKKTLAKLFK